MNILNLFSKRQARQRGEVPDVFIYDKLPRELRVQIVHIFREYLGNEGEADHHDLMVAGAYTFIVDSLCREYGVFHLTNAQGYGARNYIAELFNFILSEENVERVLDAVEVACRGIDIYSRQYDYRRRPDSKEEADAALAEINTRFQERGVGYRYEARHIIRVDSEVVHAEVVKPALSLLHDPSYKGPEAEFHGAFEYYRHKRAKEALTVPEGA